MQVRGAWSGKAHRSVSTSLERTDRKGFPCRLFLASQLNGRTSSAEWRQRRNNFSPCFSLLESHIFLMESFSWVSEGPSPLKETQTVKKIFLKMIKSRVTTRGPSLRGAWSDRDTNDIFAHCSLIFYYLDFKFSNFVCPFELHPLIWFFLKNSFRKKKNIRKTSQNSLAPSIFIVWSIVLKLGTPLLHIQAQNTLLQNF